MTLIPITACERNSDGALVKRNVVINFDMIVSIVKYVESEPHVLAMSGGEDLLVPDSTVLELLALSAQG